MTKLLISLLVVALAALMVVPATAQTNLLANPGFEAGPTVPGPPWPFTSGWTGFGNVCIETMAGPFVPNTGMYLISIFGTFSMGNDSGMVQSFAAAEGEAFEMDCFSRHHSGDPMQQQNRVFMKIVFRDQFGTEIAGVDRTVCDVNSPVDTWIDNVPIQAIAPFGTAMVEGFILFSQIPNATVPGSAQIDDVSLVKLPASLTMIQECIPISFKTTVTLSNGIPGQPYAQFFSALPANALFPNQGQLLGLHITGAEINNQFALAVSGIAPFGGLLDINGKAVFQIPGSISQLASGGTIWAVGAFIDFGGVVMRSNVAEYTFQ